MTRRIPLLILGLLLLPAPRGHAQEDAPSPPPAPTPGLTPGPNPWHQPPTRAVTERLAYPYTIDLLPDELDVPLTCRTKPRPPRRPVNPPPRASPGAARP